MADGPGRAFVRALADQGAAVSKKLDADILLFNGAVHDSDDLHGMCTRRERRRNVLLVITTNGGSADCAYRIARCLQTRYSRFIAYIRRYCKSAGTLLITGSSELVMPDNAELGPLDVQVYKPDELGEMSSGLTLTQALGTLQERSFELWEHHFLLIRYRSGLQLSTKIASEIASNITSGLLSTVYAQIDPVRLGELERTTKIALEYGERLGSNRNLKEDALERLITGYPSHGFVIDRREAEQFFRNVRAPSVEEEQLVDACDPLFEFVLDESRHAIFLDDLLSELESTITEEEGTYAGEEDTEGETSASAPRDGEEKPAAIESAEPDGVGESHNERTPVAERDSG